MSFMKEIESVFGVLGKTFKTIFSGITKELGPIAEQDLVDIANAGLAAGATAAVVAATSGAPLTLTAIEAASVLGGRAALATAQTKGLQLSAQSLLAVVSAAGLTAPEVLKTAGIIPPAPPVVTAPNQ